jgi:hypothetical protein
MLVRNFIKMSIISFIETWTVIWTQVWSVLSVYCWEKTQVPRSRHWEWSISFQKEWTLLLESSLDGQPTQLVHNFFSDKSVIFSFETQFQLSTESTENLFMILWAMPMRDISIWPLYNHFHDLIYRGKNSRDISSSLDFSLLGDSSQWPIKLYFFPLSLLIGHTRKGRITIASSAHLDLKQLEA